MSDYPAVSVATAAEELNRLHSGIEGKMRSTVQDAIRAGEILAQVKAKMPHGDFLPWVKLNCRFSERTAYNYMGLHDHSGKIATVANLQEAYKQVETIEAQAKQSEEHRARLRVDEFNRTGNKAAGWRRGTDDTLAKETKEREGRIRKMQDDLEREHEERVTPKPARDWSAETARVMTALNEQVAVAQKRQSFKESIRISHEGKDDPFVDAIMDYLETLDDDSRRIEACHNIVKVCKGIANQLQKVPA